MLIIFIIFYVIYLVRIYLVTGSLYLLNVFIHCPLSPHPTSSNHKSDLVFYGFVFEI